MTPVAHLVEPGGRGGIYHHAASLTRCLYDSGVEVVLHTAADAEDVPLPVAATPCFWRFSSVRPRALRRALFVAGWLGRGVPSCLAAVSDGAVLHIEGRFKPILLVPLVLGARLRRCTLTFNPHTTFGRNSSAAEEATVRWIARRADAVFALCHRDVAEIESWGARAVLMPFLTTTPVPDPELVEHWRRRWRRDAARPVVLVAGQIRADKGPDLLVRAAALLEERPVVAMVGEDLGAASTAKTLADALGVTLVVDEGYQPFDRFVAAIAGADVVACPYRVASQSSVLVTARSLGRPTVATAVGGLPELADVVVPPDDPPALAGGIAQALRRMSPTPAPEAHEPEKDAIRPFLEAVGFASERAPSSDSA